MNIKKIAGTAAIAAGLGAAGLGLGAGTAQADDRIPGVPGSGRCGRSWRMVPRVGVRRDSSRRCADRPLELGPAGLRPVIGTRSARDPATRFSAGIGDASGRSATAGRPSSSLAPQPGRRLRAVDEERDDGGVDAGVAVEHHGVLGAVERDQAGAHLPGQVDTGLIRRGGVVGGGYDDDLARADRDGGMRCRRRPARATSRTRHAAPAP